MTTIKTAENKLTNHVYIIDLANSYPWHQAIKIVQDRLAQALALAAEGKPREAHDLAKSAMRYAAECKESAATEDQFGWAVTIEDLALLALDLAQAALVTA